MAKYSKKAGEEVKEAMHEMKEGKLVAGRSGKKVTSRKQAIAIGLSEAREKGAKVPKKATTKTSASKSVKSARSSKTTSTKKSAGRAKAPAKSTTKSAKSR